MGAGGVVLVGGGGTFFSISQMIISLVQLMDNITYTYTYTKCALGNSVPQISHLMSARTGVRRIS